MSNTDDAIGRGQKIPAATTNEPKRAITAETTAERLCSSFPPAKSPRYWAVYGAMVAVRAQAYTDTGQNMDDVIMSAIVEEAHATAAWSEEVQP